MQRMMDERCELYVQIPQIPVSRAYSVHIVGLEVNLNGDARIGS
jgi:hypothetical protein